MIPGTIPEASEVSKGTYITITIIGICNTKYSWNNIHSCGVYMIVLYKRSSVNRETGKQVNNDIN